MINGQVLPVAESCDVELLFLERPPLFSDLLLCCGRPDKAEGSPRRHAAALRSGWSRAPLFSAVSLRLPSIKGPCANQCNQSIQCEYWVSANDVVVDFCVILHHSHRFWMASTYNVTTLFPIDSLTLSLLSKNLPVKYFIFNFQAGYCWQISNDKFIQQILMWNLSNGNAIIAAACHIWQIIAWFIFGIANPYAIMIITWCDALYTCELFLILLRRNGEMNLKFREKVLWRDMENYWKRKKKRTREREIEGGREGGSWGERERVTCSPFFSVTGTSLWDKERPNWFRRKLLPWRPSLVWPTSWPLWVSSSLRSLR